MKLISAALLLVWLSTAAVARDIGIASYYGWFHDGLLMANGRRFRAMGLTAASRTLALGTRVKVTNVSNGRTVYLIITDRGPYVTERIIDLSLGAAVRLGMIKDGLAIVRIETQ